MIFYADKPVPKLKAPSARRRYFPVHLKVNMFHRVDMQHRVNSCTIEGTQLQNSLVCDASCNYEIGSGRSYYSEDDSHKQENELMNCSLSSLGELILSSDDLAPDPQSQIDGN